MVVCDCGTQKDVASNYLIKGITISCGCAQRDAVRKTMTTHGETGTRLHRIWKAMLARTRTTGRHYAWYGAKGIVVCDEWKEFTTFRDWALANGYKDNLTIDRVNGDGNYEPGNCEWVTQAENSRRGQLGRKR